MGPKLSRGTVHSPACDLRRHAHHSSRDPGPPLADGRFLWALHNGRLSDIPSTAWAETSCLGTYHSTCKWQVKCYLSVKKKGMDSTRHGGFAPSQCPLNVSTAASHPRTPTKMPASAKTVLRWQTCNRLSGLTCTRQPEITRFA